MWNMLSLIQEDENESIFAKGCKTFNIDVSRAINFINSYIEDNNLEEQFDPETKTK